MTISELVEELNKHDPEMLVVVDGYEGGVSQKLEVIEQGILLNRNTSWYYGEHEIADEYIGEPKRDITALRIGRT